MTRRSVDDLASVHVLSTDRYWTTRDFGQVALALVEPQPSWGALGTLAMWLGAPALCFVLIGFPLLIALFVMGRMHESKKNALAAELAKALEASHLDVVRTALRAFLAEQKRLATIEASKPRAIGVTS